MLGVSDSAFRAANLRHRELAREAERMGPIRYELNQRRIQKGPGSLRRLSASLAQQIGVVRALLATALRIRRLAEQ